MKDQAAKPRKRGGRLVPLLLNIVGTLILLSVILACLPMVLPKALGYEMYNIVSGSMEPEIPIGSVIYVEQVLPEDLQVDDVIAFQSGESVIAHRVVRNQVVEGEITTKGDANEGEDMNTVSYPDVIGRVVKHIPMLGAFMEIYSTNVGKVYLIIFAGCGAMMNLLAGRIRERRKSSRE